MAASISSYSVTPLRLDGESQSDVAFEQINLPETNQRNLGAPHPTGTATPLALRPLSGGTEINLETITQAVRSLQSRGDVLTKQLAPHSALLFRGLPVHDANDFSRLAHAFGFKSHQIIGIVVDRPLLAPNVAPANESPKEVLIYNHNESPQVPHAPGYIFFYSHKTPEKGGETPISSSLELFHRAQEEIPEFSGEFAKKGILSRVTYKFEKQYAGGSTLRQAFGKHFEDGDDEATKRANIEAQLKGTPGTGLPTLFTGLAAYWKNAQGGNGVRKEVTKQLYGDGTPIPDRYLEHLAKITDEIRVLHKWQRGDVLVYDNIIAQHGRQPWHGEQSDRVVLASLFDGDNVPGGNTDVDWAHVVQALPGYILEECPGIEENFRVILSPWNVG